MKSTKLGFSTVQKEEEEHGHFGIRKSKAKVSMKSIENNIFTSHVRKKTFGFFTHIFSLHQTQDFLNLFDRACKKHKTAK